MRLVIFILIIGAIAASIPNCMKIDMVNKKEICIQCYDRYFLYFGACLHCIAGCLKCSNLKGCEVCEDSKYLNLKKLCESCPIGCKKCKDPTVCIECSDWFTINNGYCKKSSGPIQIIFIISATFFFIGILIVAIIFNRSKFRSRNTDLSTSGIYQSINEAGEKDHASHTP